MSESFRFNPPDLRSGAPQFLFDVLIAAIDVVDAVDHGLARAPPAPPAPARRWPAGRRRSPPRRSIRAARRQWPGRASMRMLAPMRTSSCACMKRFSKMVSVTSEMPCAWVISAMYCACRSVAKPGYSSVVASTDDQLSRVAHAQGIRAGFGDLDAGLPHFQDERGKVLGHGNP